MQGKSGHQANGPTLPFLTAIGSPSPHHQPSFEALEQTLDLDPQIVDADPDRADL
jgi:hypothetical protein